MICLRWKVFRFSQLGAKDFFLALRVQIDLISKETLPQFSVLLLLQHRKLQQGFSIQVTPPRPVFLLFITMLSWVVLFFPLKIKHRLNINIRRVTNQASRG